MITETRKIAKRVTLLPVVTLALFAMPAMQTAEAQDLAAAPVLNLQIKPTDRNASDKIMKYRVHLFLTKTAGANHEPSRSLESPTSGPLAPLEPEVGSLKPSTEPRDPEVESALTVEATVPSVPAPGFYPEDLSNPKNDPVLVTTQSHPLYVNAKPIEWGNPAAFLQHLQVSRFIHLVDQYIGSTAANRYTVGLAGALNYPVFTALTDNDIIQILHTGAQSFGTGYDHVYHIFLPKGVDVCFTGTSICYSPDNPSTFVFCAYHGFVDFSDIGHVLVSVEPFQQVDGCSVTSTSGTAALIDSTANVLSHELFETITDPDINAWFARNSLLAYQAEIGDVCEGPFFDYTPVVVGGVRYVIQPEYSNRYHACAYRP